MRAILRFLAFFALVSLGHAGNPVLTVSNDAEVATFTIEEFGRLPRIEITAFDGHAKQEHKYSGVAVSELLNRVHAALGEKLRGAALQTVVRVRSRDGYVVIFALAEFDQAFAARTIILADQEDGHPMRENAAPLQLIAPGDKRPARWARMVTTVEVVSIAKP